MSQKTFVKRSSSWFPDALPALVRARKRAVEAARRTHTVLIQAKGGKPVQVRPSPRAKRKPS